MDATQVITLARKHLGAGSMESSARVCLAQAEIAQSGGDLKRAKSRALRSLQYSVGIFHDDYKAAAQPDEHEGEIAAFNSTASMRKAAE